MIAIQPQELAVVPLRGQGTAVQIDVAREEVNGSIIPSGSGLCSTFRRSKQAVFKSHVSTDEELGDSLTVFVRNAPLVSGDLHRLASQIKSTIGEGDGLLRTRLLTGNHHRLAVPDVVGDVLCAVRDDIDFIRQFSGSLRRVPSATRNGITLCCISTPFRCRLPHRHHRRYQGHRQAEDHEDG